MFVNGLVSCHFAECFTPNGCRWGGFGSFCDFNKSEQEFFVKWARTLISYTTRITDPRCLRHLTDLRISNHNGHKFSLSLTESYRAYSFNFCDIQGNVKAFRLTGCSDEENWLDFFSMFFKNCGSRNSILLSFHEKRFESIFTVAWFFWTNHNSLLPMRLLHFVQTISNFKGLFFRVRQSGKGRLSSKWKDFEINKALSVVVCFFIIQKK